MLTMEYSEKESFPVRRTVNGTRKFLKVGMSEWKVRHNKDIDVENIRHDDAQIGNIAKGDLLPFGAHPQIHLWRQCMGFSNCGPKDASG